MHSVRVASTPPAAVPAAMDARILLVTGSRCLADTVSARAATHSRVAWTLAHFRPALVVHGAATGADEVAEAVARSLGIDTLAFPVETGRPVPTGEFATGALSDAEQERAWTYPERKPLARNAVMVEFCAHMRDALHAQVAVLAMVAPWSKTGGTAHTVERAEGVGFRPLRWTCPAAFGPAPARAP